MSWTEKKVELQSQLIDPRAFEIVDRLQRAGFLSYLVGGCVRDLILGIEPKDFDIATTAHPHQIKKIIPNSYIIGKRFRLVLAKRGLDQFEIATFRRDIPEEVLSGIQPTEGSENGSDVKLGNPGFILNDNFFGTPEEDARRRDFTVNGLFYDPISNQLIDFVEAERDFYDRTIRMIGDPNRRLVEDPIRSLRAIRLAHKIRFTLETSLRSAIVQHSQLVALTARPRRREEYLKILRLPTDLAILDMLDLGLIDSCLPSLKGVLQSEELFWLFEFYLSRVRDLLDPSFFGEKHGDTLVVWLPIVLVFWELHKNVDTVLKIMQEEWGAYKQELTLMGATLRHLDQIPKALVFQKRSLRRKAGFLNQPFMPYVWTAIEMMEVLSPIERLAWEHEWRDLNLRQSSM